MASSQDSNLRQKHNIKARKQLGDAESDWLKLGLGFSANACRKEEEEMGSAKMASASATRNPPYHLKGDDDEDVGLDLKLEIGSADAGAGAGLESRNTSDRNMGVALMHHQSCWKESDVQKKQPWTFHMNSVSNFNRGCLKTPLPIHRSHCLSAPNSGLWFALRSSTNNRKGGAVALPQIPKAYIRVQDENVTVFMVKKYLVTKLGLSNEAEIEIWCMGQRLLQTQSLKQVRDGVWLPKLVEFVKNSNSSSSHSPCCHHTPSSSSSSSSSSSAAYLMSLHYGRTSLF